MDGAPVVLPEFSARAGSVYTVRLKGKKRMFKTAEEALPESKPEAYEQLAAQLRALLEGERDFIANAANFSALLFHTLPRLNWAGLYLHKEGELVLGPFQGRPACVRIRLGEGVCGTAAGERRTVVVPNVHEFPGHIACDTASNSEVVVPLLAGESLVGVLDLDSPDHARFDDEDAAGLQRLARIFLDSSDLSWSAKNYSHGWTGSTG